MGSAVDALSAQQTPEGFWCGELTADTTLESDYILLQLWLNQPDENGWNPPTRRRIDKAARSILERQLADGGFNIYAGGPSDVNATIKGVNDLKAEYVAKYGDDGVGGNSYVPNLATTYWTFRLMIGFGAGAAILALTGLWWTRKGSLPTGKNAKRFGLLALIAIPTPYLANFAGWIFTEMGRQPWIVAPNPTGDPAVRMSVKQAVSPFVDTATVATSLIVFTLLYGTLAVVWYALIRHEVTAGAPALPTTGDGTDTGDGTTGTGTGSGQDAPLTFAY